MQAQDYATLIGRCWMNFNSLELIMRTYLATQGQPMGLSGKVGESFPINTFTNYDTFREIARKVNAKSGEQYDFSRIIAYRDAMAHGRVFSADDNFPLTVVKFSKPIGGAVKVEYSQLLSETFLLDMSKEIVKVLTTIHALIP